MRRVLICLLLLLITGCRTPIGIRPLDHPKNDMLPLPTYDAEEAGDAAEGR